MLVHRGNCRAITSNSNDGFGDLSRKVDEVFDSILKEDYNQRENSSPNGISEKDKSFSVNLPLVNGRMTSFHLWEVPRSGDIRGPQIKERKAVTLEII